MIVVILSPSTGSEKIPHILLYQFQKKKGETEENQCFKCGRFFLQ